MKFFLDLLFLAGLKRVYDLLLDLVKVEVATLSLRAVDRVRQIFTMMLVAIFCFTVISLGFIAIHVALFILLPWDISTKAVIFLVLGLLYFFVPLITIVCLHSRRRWIRVLRVDALIERLSKKD